MRFILFLLYLLLPSPAYATGDGAGLFILISLFAIGMAGTALLYFGKKILDIFGFKFAEEESHLRYWLKIVSIPVIFIVTITSINPLLNFSIRDSSALRKQAEAVSSASHDEILTLAQKGDTAAQHRAGEYYATGTGGFEEDIAEAYFWFSLAGDKALSDRAAEELTAPQLAELDKRVKKWKLWHGKKRR